MRSRAPRKIKLYRVMKYSCTFCEHVKRRMIDTRKKKLDKQCFERLDGVVYCVLMSSCPFKSLTLLSRLANLIIYYINIVF